MYPHNLNTCPTGTYKKICDNHDEDYYKEFKEWADRYFYIKHRDETRGLGGIFFDDQNDRDPETIFEFSKECLNKHRKYLNEFARNG